MNHSPVRINSHKSSRPLRFLAVILTIWVGGRLVFTYAPRLLREHSPQIIAEQKHPEMRVRKRRFAEAIDRRPLPSLALAEATSAPLMATPYQAPHTIAAFPAFTSAAAATPRTLPTEKQPIAPVISSPNAPQPYTQAARPEAKPPLSRWTKSVWMLWRPKGPVRAIATDGQLGGAQLGFRADRYLGSTNRAVSLYGRLSGALHEPMAPESAFGIALHPVSGRVTMSVGLERRIPLDNDGRNAFATLITAGINPTHLGQSFYTEGYAQTGMVGFNSTDLFIDGRLSVTTPITRQADRASVGFTLSGGAQPGTKRLDIGPVLALRPLPSAQAIRLSVEWRQRVVGRAAPGSGPAITIASDF